MTIHQIQDKRAYDCGTNYIIFTPQEFEALKRIYFMTIYEIQDKQRDEHSKLEEHILKNVAERKWTKKKLREQLSNLYLMGYRHGCEAAHEMVANPPA